MQKLYKRLFLTERPLPFVPQNDGQETVIYNHNIEEGVNNIEEGNPVNGFFYDSLDVPYPLTQRNVLAVLIGELYPANVELKMQNDYQAALLSIESEEKKQPYIDYLAHRKELKAMVISDCNAAGVPELLPE